MRSLLTLWIITLFFLSNPSSAGQPFQPAQTELPITFDGYWKLVSDTRQAVVQMEGKPEAAIRQGLNALASQWEQVTAVEYPDHSVTQIDSSYLAAELRRDPPDLKRLVNEFDALLGAHEEYPQKVFTPADIARLQEILKRPEFQWRQAQSPQMPPWLANLYEQFSKLMDRIARGVINFVYQWRDLFKVAALLLFLFSLFFISRGLARSLAKEAQLAADDPENDEMLTSKGALQRAETLSMQGDYRNAVRYLYLSSLLVLDEQGLMRYDRSRTNREYLRSVASKPELAKPLRDVIDVFDRVWYGFEGVDEQTYQSYVERVDELREKKE